MTIGSIAISRKQLISLLVLLVLTIGLVVAIILVRNQQIFKSRANIDLSSTFTVTDEIGNEVNCSGTTCSTYSNTVQIKFNQDQLEALKNSLP